METSVHTTPRALLFDLDETLFDRRAGLIRYATGMWETQPVDAATREDFIASFIALDGNGRIPRKDFFDQLCAQHLPQADPAAQLDDFIRSAWVTPILFEDAERVLGTLRQSGYRLAIVSNGQSATQRAKILNSGLREMVDAFVISGELGRRKPEPAIFLHVLDQLGVPPAAAWHIGDCPFADVQGALNTGLRAIWLERHTPWPADRAPDYHARISHLAELLPMLEHA